MNNNYKYHLFLMGRTFLWIDGFLFMPVYFPRCFFIGVFCWAVRFTIQFPPLFKRFFPWFPIHFPPVATYYFPFVFAHLIPFCESSDPLCFDQFNPWLNKSTPSVRIQFFPLSYTLETYYWAWGIIKVYSSISSPFFLFFQWSYSL